MSIIRVYSPETYTIGETCKLSEEESHHLMRVRRRGLGDKVQVINGKGQAWEGILDSMAKKVACVKILKTLGPFQQAQVKITLVQAMLKGKTFEGIIKQATEIGISEIIPVTTQRTKKMGEKVEKWEKIAQEACKQSGNPYMPIIRPVRELRAAIKKLNKPDNLNLVGSLCDDSKKLEEIITNDIKQINWYIGPEGDFTEEEYSVLKNAGAVGVRLTNNVLRAETAAGYVMAVTDYLTKKIA